MTHTTDNPTPRPSNLAGFLAGGYHHDCPSASLTRCMALDDMTRQQRFEEAFDVLLDDSVDLDDGLGQAGPVEVARNSWMHTVMGRRAAEMLIRLEASYMRLVREGSLEAAWAVIEACTGYVAVAVWLQEVQGFPAESYDEVGPIEGLVERVGPVPYLLVTEFAKTLPAHEVLMCSIEAERLLIDGDPGGLVGVELDHLHTHGAPQDIHLLNEAISIAAEAVRHHLEDAIDRRDFDFLEQVLRLGVGLVYIQLRVEDGGEAEVA